MVHLHSVYDVDSHFRIDGITRQIRNESSAKSNLIQYDHNSERFTFDMPKEIEGHNMMNCNVVEVHYLNIDSVTGEVTKGIYAVEDMQLSPTDENVVIFSWLISANATQRVGLLNFLVRFACVADDGTVEYAWHTDTYKKISISSGINNTDYVVTKYADVLEQWKNEILNIAKGTNGFSPIVNFTEVAEGYKLSITDEDGTKEVLLKHGENGSDGHTPVKGVDYFDGKDGKNGVSATIQIGTVTTGEAGTEAQVTNRGTENNAIFDFVIPKGETGSGGGVIPDWNQNDETAPDYIKNRPFYDESLVSVPFPGIDGCYWYKVSDQIPTGDMPNVNDRCYVELNGNRLDSNIAIISQNDYYTTTESMVVVALKDNVNLEGLIFPKKGTYFIKDPDVYVSGFALGSATTPEIVWDGNTGTLKQINEKYIPEMNSVTLLSSTTDSTKKFKITVDDNGDLIANGVNRTSDERINSLIDAKLGVIENGTY